MKQIILPVTVHLNIRLPLALLQPEPAAAPTGPEPEAWSCQDLFSPKVQGFQILGDLSLLGHHIARWRRQVKGGDSRGEANPLDVAPPVCYPLPQAACALTCSR